jgi:galactokinase
MITADLPADAGLSSSSALVVAIAMAIVDRLDLRRDKRFQERIPDRLAEAEYYGALETGAPFRDTAGDHGVGVAGGAQDSVAILCAEQGACGLYHYLPARLERQIPWPDTHVLAVAVSGVRASKIGNARDNYNRTAHALRSLLAALNAQHGTAHRSVAAALGSDPEALPALQQLARSGVDDLEPRYLSARLQQFVEETGEIVPAAAAALEAGDLSAFGHWVARSQTGAEQGLGNQVQETIFLARSALEHGAVAASAFGAGFGGAVWAMIARQDAASFQAGWAAGYGRQFPEHAAQAQFFLTSPAASAARLLPDE